MAQSALAVVHAIPGRLRLRLPPFAETSGLADAARAVPGVTDSVWNERTHGLLVRYQPEETTPAAVIDAVTAHAGIAAPADGTDAAPRYGPVAAVVTSAVTDLNVRVARATRGRLDLGVLVPLALTAWALRDMMRSPIAPLAWSSALWYAHGLFRDYALRERS